MSVSDKSEIRIEPRELQAILAMNVIGNLNGQVPLDIQRRFQESMNDFVQFERERIYLNPFLSCPGTVRFSELEEPTAHALISSPLAFETGSVIGKHDETIIFIVNEGEGGRFTKLDLNSGRMEDIPLPNNFVPHTGKPFNGGYGLLDIKGETILFLNYAMDDYTQIRLAHKERQNNGAAVLAGIDDGQIVTVDFKKSVYCFFSKKGRLISTKHIPACLDCGNALWHDSNLYCLTFSNTGDRRGHLASISGSGSFQVLSAGLQGNGAFSDWGIYIFKEILFFSDNYGVTIIPLNKVYQSDRFFISNQILLDQLKKLSPQFSDIYIGCFRIKDVHLTLNTIIFFLRPAADGPLQRYRLIVLAFPVKSVLEALR